MGYAATKRVIIYWKPDHDYYIHRAHHAWFYKHNYRLYTEDNHTPIPLFLQNILNVLFMIFI